MAISEAAAAVESRVPAGDILVAWRRFSAWPFGRWLFGKMIARKVPYSGTVKARVLAVEPGSARVELRDRRRIRNHLDSIHACAQVTAGELASGLAMLAALPAGARAIVTGIEIEYLKKARGTLTVTGMAPGAGDLREGEFIARAELCDASGDVVSRLRVRWLVGPGRPHGRG